MNHHLGALILSLLMMSPLAFAELAGEKNESINLSEFGLRTNKPNSFRFQTDIGKESYKLVSASGGSNYQLTGSSNIGYGLIWLQSGDKSRNLYGYETHTISHNSATGFSPGRVSENVRELYWENQTFAFSDQSSWTRNVYFGFGVHVKDRKAETTYPWIMVNSSSSFGFRFTTGYESRFSRNFSVEGIGTVMMPVYMREYSAHTGDFNYSLNLAAEAKVVYHVSDWIDTSIGFIMSAESNVFNSSGNRNTLNSTEMFTNMLIPIDIRFQF